jgi:hypothetical protein
MPKLIAGHTLINYDENVPRVVIPKFVFSIADRAFSERGQIKAIEVGESVKSIGNYAFRMCYNMREITLPTAVDEFGKGVFENCWALERVKLPEGVKLIDDEMFVDCNNLREISLPGSIQEISRDAFSRVPKLVYVHISPEKIELLPESVSDIAILSYMDMHNNDGDGQEKISDLAIINGYIDERGDSLTKLAIDQARTLAIRYMVRRGLVQSEHIAELVELAAKMRSSEIVALLIDEQTRVQSDKGEPAQEEWDPFA